MATATVRVKTGTTAEWIESHRVLDDGELGLELTVDGHRIIRIGNGATEFMDLPVSFDIEEVREIKKSMDDNAKTYYEDMVKKGTELVEEMKAMKATVVLKDEATGTKYQMGLSGGAMYFEEMEKEVEDPDTGGDPGGEDTGGETGESEGEQVEDIEQEETE